MRRDTREVVNGNVEQALDFLLNLGPRVPSDGGLNPMIIDPRIRNLHSYEKETVRFELTRQVRTAHPVEQEMTSNNSETDLLQEL